MMDAAWIASQKTNQASQTGVKQKVHYKSQEKYILQVSKL